MLLQRSSAGRQPRQSARAPPVDICFRPGAERCGEQIAAAIARAQRTILLQAYSFTSAPIAAALLEAKKQGAEIRAVLDKSNRSAKYTPADFLAHTGAKVRIDERVAIAHSKVIVIEDELVVTASYSFTKAAEERNAENVLFLRDRCVAGREILPPLQL